MEIGDLGRQPAGSGRRIQPARQLAVGLQLGDDALDRGQPGSQKQSADAAAGWRIDRRVNADMTLPEGRKVGPPELAAD